MMAIHPEISVAVAGIIGKFELDAAFNVPMQGITALYGPSGSGKTTILRCIAGLQRLPGRVIVGGEVWQDTSTATFLPTHRRNLGYVFQEASLFAHLSVRKNLLYGAARAMPPVAGEPDFNSIVELLGITHLLDRSVSKLSGGERQRVAVSRALLSAPEILLMDEPLSALDRDVKEEILPFFAALHEKFAIPILYVSHDMAEIERLADRIVLVEAGRVAANGALSDMQVNPNLPFLSRRDAAVTLDGLINEFDEAYGLTSFAVAGGKLIVPGGHGGIGTVRRLRIAASDVSFALSKAADTTILNCLAARIATIDGRPGGPQLSVVAALGPDGTGCRIAARITRKSRDALSLEAGSPVFVQIKSVALVA